MSRDLSGHLKLRHGYDYGEVIENEESEEMQLMKALQASLNQYWSNLINWITIDLNVKQKLLNSK